MLPVKHIIFLRCLERGMMEGSQGGAGHLQSQAQDGIGTPGWDTWPEPFS